MMREVEVDPRLGTVVIIVCGVGFTLSGLLLVAYMVYMRREAARSANWPSTEGEVIHSKPRSFSTAYYTMHDARVTYRYWVDGRKYVSSRVTPESLGFGSRREAEEVAKRFPGGGRVRVYYDPKKPGRAVLLPGKRADGSLPSGFLMAVTFVLLVGLYFLLFVR